MVYDVLSNNLWSFRQQIFWLSNNYLASGSIDFPYIHSYIHSTYVCIHIYLCIVCVCVYATVSIIFCVCILFFYFFRSVWGQEWPLTRTELAVGDTQWLAQFLYISSGLFPSASKCYVLSSIDGWFFLLAKCPRALLIRHYVSFLKLHCWTVNLIWWLKQWSLGSIFKTRTLKTESIRGLLSSGQNKWLENWNNIDIEK